MVSQHRGRAGERRVRPQEPPASATRRYDVLLESRYVKLVRGLPQTIFHCPECKGHPRRKRHCPRCAGSGRLAADSVQECIGRVLLPAFRARTGKFHGAGREDRDVRMLGSGRPFVYEVVGARRRLDELDLGELRDRVAERSEGRVELTEPWLGCTRARIAELKAGVWQKLYRVEMALDGVVDAAALERLRGFDEIVRQRTPDRVAHRRADRVRPRRVTVLRVEQRKPGRLEIDVRTEHGTYVKEWVSGEDGRSVPSAASVLGVPGHCAALDVLAVLDDAGAVPGGA